MPAAVLREEALRRNIAEMQDFADRQGAFLCPHGKTTMSPELFRLQLEAGAWGLTAATAHHLRVYRRIGVGRIFLASILGGRADLDLVMAELAEDPAFEFYGLVDAPAAVEALAGAARAHGIERDVDVLVETGIAGGRSGARTTAEAMETARAVAASPPLRLRGVETFEGIHQTGGDARLEAAEMIDLALIAAHEIVREGLLGEGPVMFSAGGSAFLDLCAARLPKRIEGRDVKTVIRPGCYVTHDSGLYERLTHPDGRLPPGLPALSHALEVWGTVLSVPEPDLAIVGVGKRDLSHDVALPVPLHVYRYENKDKGEPKPANGFSVGSLWDQHISVSVPSGAVAVGDLIGFGISHPCATFDRWSAMLTVDATYRVTGAVTTLF